MEQLELIRFVVSKAGYIQIFNFHMQTFFWYAAPAANNSFCVSVFPQTIFLRTCIQLISVFTAYANNLFQNFPTPLPVQIKNDVKSISRHYSQYGDQLSTIDLSAKDLSFHDNNAQMLDTLLTIGWFSNRTGASVDDGARRSKNWLDHWLDQWQSGKLGTGSRV